MSAQGLETPSSEPAVARSSHSYPTFDYHTMPISKIKIPGLNQIPRFDDREKQMMGDLTAG
jgi:hypothetical protein